MSGVSCVVQWQWVIVPAYDLDVGIVNKFLGEVFPENIYRIKNFYTQVFKRSRSILEAKSNRRLQQWNSDTIRFWVPRKLSEVSAMRQRRGEMAKSSTEGRKRSEVQRVSSQRALK
jgi:hypothetical protein